MARQYRLRGAEVWERAREDYLAGDDAYTVCDRYDIGLSNLRRRAHAEGWRRVDQPELDPKTFDECLDHDVGGEVIADPQDVLAYTMERSLHLALEGRITEASRWLRYHRAMAATVNAPAAALEALLR